MTIFHTQYVSTDGSTRPDPKAEHIDIGDFLDFIYHAPASATFTQNGRTIDIGKDNCWTLGWSSILGYIAFNNSTKVPSIKYFNSLDELLNFDTWFSQKAGSRRDINKQSSIAGSCDFDDHSQLIPYLLALQEDFEREIARKAKFKFIFLQLRDMGDKDQIQRGFFKPRIQEIRDDHLAGLSLTQIQQYFRDLRDACPNETYEQCHTKLNPYLVV